MESQLYIYSGYVTRRPKTGIHLLKPYVLLVHYDKLLYCKNYLFINRMYHHKSEDAKYI